MATPIGPIEVHERYRQLTKSGDPHQRNFSYSYGDIQRPVEGAENVARLRGVFAWLLEEYRERTSQGEPARVPVLVHETCQLARISLMPLFPVDEPPFGD